MNIQPLKTPILSPGKSDIYTVLRAALPTLQDGVIVVVTSKIVSICEGSVVPIDGANKEQLVVQESDYYLPHTLSKYGHHFTVTANTLISMAGIDESNGADCYILWPRDVQQSANDIRQFLVDTCGVQNIGVIISDSTCQPLRRGTTGIAMAHSGFLALRNYIGQPDLFGTPLKVTQANVSGGLAAAAVVAMGEGAEQTPLCLMSDVPGLTFQNRNPSAEELAAITLTMEDDLFAPFLTAVPWQPGNRTGF